jgi:hypothetical protein
MAIEAVRSLDVSHAMPPKELSSSALDALIFFLGGGGWERNFAVGSIEIPVTRQGRQRHVIMTVKNMSSGSLGRSTVLSGVNVSRDK